MEEINVYDLEDLAKTDISITFDRYGMTVRKYGHKDTGEVMTQNYQLGYEILYHLDMSIQEIIDVAFPVDKEGK